MTTWPSTAQWHGTMAYAALWADIAAVVEAYDRDRLLNP